MRTLMVFLLSALALIGCDKDKARKTQKAVKEAASKASQEVEDSKMLAHAQQVIRAVESRNIDSLRRLCVDQEDGDYRDIMSCYYNAFVIENEQGVDAARRYLADEMTKDGNPPVKDKAVKALNDYFTAKGTLRTKEVAGLILIIALEAKYPHRGGILGGVIAEKLGLINLPKSATQPTTQYSSDPALGS